MNFYFVISVCLTVSNVALAKVVKIIGGEDADIKHFPYIASLRYIPKNTHFCAGAIISNWHILTAAHCVLYLKSSDFQICVGSNNITDLTPCYKIQHFLIHPQFLNNIRASTGHDIALITVDTYISFNEFQNKVDLPTKDIHPGEICVTVGWGWTSFPIGGLFEILQKTYMKIFSNNECEDYFPLIIQDQHICAFEKEVGMCFGDSGGPLVSNNTLVGISSFVHPCAKGDPDVFTRVYSFLDFIKASMNLSNNFPCCVPL